MPEQYEHVEESCQARRANELDHPFCGHTGADAQDHAPHSNLAGIGLSRSQFNLLWRRQLDEGDKDLTVLRVEVEGLVEGEQTVRRYDLLDRFDTESNITSMARTTGYTCTAMVNAIAEGLYSDPGLSPPELVGRNEECFFFIFDYLAARGIRFEVTEQSL